MGGIPDVFSQVIYHLPVSYGYFVVCAGEAI